MKEITINLAWLMKLLEAVIATLGRLLPPLPGMADRKSSRSESSGGDRSHRDDSSNNKTTYGSDEKDPFEILGLKRNTTIEEAKKAMRKLALTWHPDRNIDNTEEATKKMQEINDAYHRVKKILECGGDDGKDEEADQSESEDESVYESESARRNARKKKWKQQDDNEKEFARKVRKEFINFERAQRNAARGNYDYEPPSFKETTSKSSKSAKKNARQRRAKKRKVNKAAHCSHLDGSNRSNEIGTKAADVNNIPFHQLVPEKRCLIKFRSKDLLKTPTFTAIRVRAYNVLLMLTALENPCDSLISNVEVFVTPLMIASYLGDYTAVDIIIRNAGEKWRETVLMQSRPGGDDSLALATEARDVAQKLYDESMSFEANSEEEREGKEKIAENCAERLEMTEKLVNRLYHMKQLALEKRRKENIRSLLMIPVGLAGCILCYYCLRFWTFLRFCLKWLLYFLVSGAFLSWPGEVFVLFLLYKIIALVFFASKRAQATKSVINEPSPSKPAINDSSSSRPFDPTDFFCIDGEACFVKGDVCTDNILKLDCECGDDLKYSCTKWTSTTKKSFDQLNNESTAVESIGVFVCLALYIGALLYFNLYWVLPKRKKKMSKKS